jgi:hypothetical protein
MMAKSGDQKKTEGGKRAAAKSALMVRRYLTLLVIVALIGENPSPCDVADRRSGIV